MLGVMMALLVNVSFGQHDKSERIEAMKVTFITDHLKLTPEEAQQFWPVFNQFEEERKALRQQYQQRAGMGVRPNTQITEENAETMINNELEFRAKDLDLTKRYIAKFKKMLLERIKKDGPQK